MARKKRKRGHNEVRKASGKIEEIKGEKEDIRKISTREDRKRQKEEKEERRPSVKTEERERGNEKEQE